MDRAVVGGQDHRHATAFRLLERFDQRRTFEPGARQRAQRGGVAGNLEERLILGAAVRQLVDEVEDQRRHALPREMPRESAQHRLAIGGGEDLLVMHRHVAAHEFAQLFDEQLGLVRIQ